MIIKIIIALILLGLGIWAGYRLTSNIGFKNNIKDFNTIAKELIKEGKIEELEELRATSPNWTLNLDKEDLKNLNLSRINLSGLNIIEGDFSNSNFSFSDLRNSSFTKCNFSGCLIKEVQLNDSSFIECNFTKSTIENCDFSNSILTKNIFTESKQKENNFSNSKSTDNKDLITAGFTLKVDELENKEIIKNTILQISRNNNYVYFLTPGIFEKVVEELISFFGYKTELASSRKNIGYDISAWKEEALGIEKILIEVKRTPPDKKVGLSSVRALLASKLKERANKATIVTSSYFTYEAKKYVENNNDLSLIEFPELMDWVKKYVT